MMGLETMYPKPHLSRAGEPSIRYPYLLRGIVVDRIDQVWSCDITYIRLTRGFVYLMAVIDWFSRYVLAWELSTTLDTSFCLDALDRALRGATPEIFNTVQGVQFTSAEFTNRLKTAKIRISWDGRGRALADFDLSARSVECWSCDFFNCSTLKKAYLFVIARIQCPICRYTSKRIRPSASCVVVYNDSCLQ